MGDDRERGSGNGCFGCSATNERGLGLLFRRVGDSVEAETALDEAYEGYGGLAHGGIVTTLLDEAMGWAILELAGRFAVTRSLTVEFRRPVRTNNALRVTSRIAGEEADGALRVEAGLADSRGRLLASAVGVWVPVRSSRVRGGKGPRP